MAHLQIDPTTLLICLYHLYHHFHNYYILNSHLSPLSHLHHLNYHSPLKNYKYNYYDEIPAFTRMAFVN